MRRVDFLIPVYNEASGLERFHKALARIISQLEYQFRFIYIDDGSSDGTAEILAHLMALDRRVKPLLLTRNFGHQAALSAGLDASDADAIIMMDGDGEHPPELIPEMLKLYESGYEVIQTQRIDRGRSQIRGKRLSGSVFYRLINRLGDTNILEGGADFRLLSHAAATALRQLPEYHRFYRGMVPWIGFRSLVLPYTPSPRIAGRSKYSLRKMLRLASDGIFSFSLSPLRFGLLIGTVFVFLAVTEVIYVLSFWLRGNTSSLVPGWSSLMVMLTVSSGITMLLQGILGIYLGMIFQEVKRRPVYLVRPMAPAAPPQPTIIPDEPTSTSDTANGVVAK
jgi:polyisoprenyl-phosphate glycosyltransferase